MSEPITQVLGIVSIKNRGAYDSEAQYEKLNVVTYNGSSYCAKTSVQGVLPTNTEYWDLMVSKGDTGEQGPKPVKGVDYYTDTDIADLESTLSDDVTTEVSSQLSELTSATPLVAATEDDMTDTTRIYVLETDGHWYWNDGTDWQDGGVYQAVKLDDNSVHYINFDNELQNSFENVKNTTNINILTSGIVNSDGTISSSSYTGHYDINVSPYEEYKLHIKFPSSLYTYPAIQLLYNDTVISNIMEEDLEFDDNDFYTITLDIPETVNRIRFNTSIGANSLNNIDYILKSSKYQVGNISKAQLNNQLQSCFIDDYEEVTPTQFIANAFLSKTGASAYNGTEVLTLSVNPYEKYRITAKQVSNNPVVIFTTNNKLTTKTISETDYSIKNYSEYLVSTTSGNEYQNEEFTIPEYCNTIYINHASSDTTFKLEKSTSYKVRADSGVDYKIKTGFSKLYAIGDSITANTIRALHNYLYWLKQDIPDITIENLGRSGSGYMNSTNTFIDRINLIDNYSLENDVIIVMGSVNDKSHIALELGQLGDTTTSTLYGCMYQFFNTLFNKFNGVRVGCISPLNWKYGTNEKANLGLYIQALKETCDLFNVPFLDIHNTTNLRPENSTFRTVYYAADGIGSSGEIDNSGIHPNSLGHKMLYGRIKDFILKL